MKINKQTCKTNKQKKKERILTIFFCKSLMKVVDVSIVPRLA
jgi:hypothetical protein